MTTLLRTAYLLAFPHGGQRRARANAYAAATAARAAAAERAAAYGLRRAASD